MSSQLELRGPALVRVILIALLPAAASASQITYTVTVLPVGPTYTSLNDNGQVAGYISTGPSTYSPIIGTVSGYTIQPIPGSGTSASASTISDNGVIGGTTTGNGAFIGDTALGLDGGGAAAGSSLNDAGQLAGVVFAGGHDYGFIATTSGYQNLSMLDTDFTSINASGVAVGFTHAGTSLPGVDPQAMYGTASGVTVIPLLSGWTAMYGYGISSAGNICGLGDNGSTLESFYFNASTSTVTPISPGTTSISSFGCMNDSNQVVGTLSFGVGGFVWDPVNGTQILDNLVPAGWNISTAISINNNGDILATEYNGSTTTYLLLDPAAPEPSTFLLLGPALVALVVMRLRKAASGAKTLSGRV